MKADELEDHTVRVRFRIPARNHIHIDSNEAVFSPKGLPKVALRSRDKDGRITKSDWLILQSSGWDTEESASDASAYLMDTLRMSLARHGMSADFGSRTPQSGIFNVFLRDIEEVTGKPALNDFHGSMVFPTKLDPDFIDAGSLTTSTGVGKERWEKTFIIALESHHSLSDRSRTAFDVYNAAHASKHAVDAWFVLLFAAFECLVDNIPRSQPAIDHVDKLIKLTKGADLESAERASLLGSLRHMRNQSIHKSGKLFVAERLDGRMYMEKHPAVFFSDCYKMRNNLVHGNQPYPTFKEVSDLVGALDQMVGHLLAGPMLKLDPD